jgi:UDP-N-acetylglucosamine transferase subunit ALG13
MIKVAIGTEKFPMVKVFKWLERAIDDGYLPKDEEILVQSGVTEYSPRYQNIKLIPTVPYQQQMQEFKDARICIIHAGMGNLLDLADLGRLPIIIPRDPKLGEHLDSHQLDFCKVAAQELPLPIAYTYEQFVVAIQHYKPETSFPSFKSDLVAYLISIVEQY